MKTCGMCKIEKALTEFNRQKAAKDGFQGRCRSCFKLSDWSSVHRLSRYGITADQFEEMLEAQGGRCAICRAPTPGGRGTWHIDHDHSCCASRKCCGKCVRGLLCSGCNQGLGNFKDDPARLESAVRYLKREAC